MNLRANFDKNKKVSRIKALREFTMKRLTDFFGEKGWKTGKMGYNENRKRSKYCCWTVPMSDWNILAKRIQDEVDFVLVEPYLWVIETSNFFWFFHSNWFYVEPYLWVIETSICKLMSVSALMLYVELYLWVICCFCWTHCFIRILWIVSLIFKENTNKKMLQLIKSWSFFVKKFWLQDVGMYLQWRRCCPREIREMLLIISA